MRNSKRRLFADLELLENWLSEKNGDKVRIKVVKKGENDSLLKMAEKNAVDLVNTLNDLFQAIQMPVSLSNESWTSPQKKVYKSIKFSFSSNHDPSQWLDLLINFSGLRITTIKYDINNRNWYYEGAIYVL